MKKLSKTFPKEQRQEALSFYENLDCEKMITQNGLTGETTVYFIGVLCTK